MFPVIKVQQQRITAFHILFVDFHHQHVVGHLLNIGTVIVQFHYAVGLAQITVGVVDVFDHETRVILAAHRIVVGATNKMRHRRRQFDHLFCLCDIIDPFGADQQRALCTVEERFDQQRL